MSLPCDQMAQLFHAMLHRKGVKTFRKEIQTDKAAGSLSERLAGIFQVDNTE